MQKILYIRIINNEISLEVDNTDRLLKLLESGQLDFAIIEGNFDSFQYAHKKYKQEKFIGICSANHSFAGKTVSIKDTFYEHLILREDGSGTRSIFENYLKEKNYSLKDFERITSVGNFGLLLELIKKQNAISFGYESLLQQGNNELSYFYIKNWNLVHAFNYVFLDNKYSHKAVKYFESYRER